jgi:hypothetical protein
MPDDPNFMRDVHDPAVAAMEAALRDCCVSEERCSHRRGNFPQLTEGDSMGGGQKRPGALVNGVENTRILNHLTALPAFIRLAGFATGMPQSTTHFAFLTVSQVFLLTGHCGFSTSMLYT